MNKVEYKQNQNTLTIFLEGRIDSTSASSVEEKINQILTSNKYDELVMDLEKLEYISSAGLRVILRVLKKNQSVHVINASQDVYEIFEMTGFTEMADIAKAYRKVSVDGCEVIGQGANGKVYRIDRDTIVKVYMNSDALPDIKRERELARKAFVLGIPTAIPYDVVKVGDTYGSVFELLNAKSFAKLITEDESIENIDKYVKMSVELLKQIHFTQVNDCSMPDMKEVVLGWAKFLKDYLPQDKEEKLLKLIEDVPYTKNMMHGDYHFKNIMLQNGEALLIDMDTLCIGNPVFEFGSIYNAYVGFSYYNPEIVEKFLGIKSSITSVLWQKTLELYLGTKNQEEIEKASNKAIIVGLTRLIRRSIRRGGLENKESLFEINNNIKRLCELLDKVDSLKF